MKSLPYGLTIVFRRNQDWECTTAELAARFVERTKTRTGEKIYQQFIC